MRVEGLTVRGVFEGVSFALAPGEAVALVGGAGSGKSTLLRALAGFQPYGGTVEAGRRGLVFSDPEAQLSGLCSTVREEVAWGLGNLGVPRPEMASRVDAVLARLGLSEVCERSPFALSGGQQQRVALASILVLEPAVLLLDEPVAMLDPEGREALFEAVAGQTLIWATPSLAEAARFPRWLWLSEGRLEDGPARIPAQHRCLEAPWTREARRRGLADLPVRAEDFPA